MHEQKSCHFLVVKCKDVKCGKLEDKMVVRHVVVQVEGKEGRNCMVKDLAV